MTRSAWATSVVSLCLGVLTSVASFADQPGLTLERTIPLGKVSGRIDHLAIDLARKRLFVSELGANSVAVFDLQSGQVIRQIDRIRSPFVLPTELAAHHGR